ncbi:MAG: hypothetical protein MK116_12975 [Phycisphaerales bacterium]|nr:hypothetical protein [Phycisphaerales bacterium]
MIDPRKEDDKQSESVASNAADGDDSQIDDEGTFTLVRGGKVYTVSPAQPDDPIFNEGYRVTMKGSPAADQDPEDSSPDES